MSASRIQIRRRAVLQEIATAGMGLLAAGELVTLSSVSRQMGLTTPALYHYIRDSAALYNLVSDAIMDKLLAYLDEQVAHCAPAASLDRAVVATLAFREWSLAHGAEFRHVFLPSPEQIHIHPDSSRAARIAEYIAVEMTRIAQATPEMVSQSPPPHLYPAALLRDALDFGTTGESAVRHFAATYPLGYVQAVRMWGAAFGIVTLQLFDQLASQRETMDMIFVYLQTCNAAEFGIPLDAAHVSALLARIRANTHF